MDTVEMKKKETNKNAGTNMGIDKFFELFNYLDGDSTALEKYVVMRQFILMAIEDLDNGPDEIKENIANKFVELMRNKNVLNEVKECLE